MAKTKKDVEYKGKSIDEILEQIEVDKAKYQAKERIIGKKIERKLPLFWQKQYVYSVRYETHDAQSSRKGGARLTEKEMILRMLEEEDATGQTAPVLAEKKEMPFTPTQESKLSVDKKAILDAYKKQLEEAEIRSDVVETVLAGTKRELVDVDYENKEKVEEEIIRQMVDLMGDTPTVALNDIKKIVLIGPTGVGKTTTIGKIAGILVSQGKKVGFITTDVYRIGATKQLDIYAEIVQSTMEPVYSPEELEEAIHYFENVEKVDHILIDTVGRSPMDAGNVEDMKAYLEVANPDHTCLVLSCTQKEKDIYKIVENFETARIDSLVFTKLDETLHHGVIMNLLADKKAKVSFISNGQDVPQDLYVANPTKLANKMLRGVDDFERPSI